jgi:hypothetical protein
MPVLQAAARTFMFVADAPTTTTQRLKSLATGGLPSFFDISTSFTAGAVPDDNLVDQMAAAGKQLVGARRCVCRWGRHTQPPQAAHVPAERAARASDHIRVSHRFTARQHFFPVSSTHLGACLRCPQAFLGDTTWQQLFPRAWAWSRPFPCFNVKDLHTVDDGVWRHLLPALRNHSSWDGLLVAHYLGVDHCGHAHGVSTQQMADKLRWGDSAGGAMGTGGCERVHGWVKGRHELQLGRDWTSASMDSVILHCLGAGPPPRKPQQAE